MSRLLDMLSTGRAQTVLLVLNAVVTMGVFVAFLEPHGGDRWSYEALADGLLHGNYSMWWHLPVQVPDTFRNPGYPAFLAVFRAFTSNAFPVQVAQLVLYCLSVAMVLRIITGAGGGRSARNLFLLLLLPSINIAYYNTGLFAEPLAMCLICTFVLLEVNGPLDVRRAVLLGLTAGLAFQCRSTLLLLPITWAMVQWWLHRRACRPVAIFSMLLVFVLTALPYTMWNYNHHGVMKPTPLEGGGGVMHMAWWSGRLPGHTEAWYWGNTCAVEMVPFVDPVEVPAEIDRFNAEWATINERLRPLLTSTDSTMLLEHKHQDKLFRTFSTAYTLEREAALKEAVIANMKEKPGYTLAHMAYTAVRQWVTGVQMDRWYSASARGKVAELYPFLLTLSIFLLGLTLIPLALYRTPGLWRTWTPLLLWVVYFGGVHVPFVIQARYTIPVRFLLMALIAMSIERLLSRPGPAITPRA